MPRAKYDETNPYNLLFHEIGYFKINYSDFLYDFKYIYEDILGFYGDSISPCDQEIANKIKAISKAKVIPAFKNRIYILTDIYEVVLAVVDIDECVFDNLVGTFDTLEFLEANIASEIHNMSYITTMYFFEGTTLLKAYSLSTRKLAQFMMVFKNENLVNYQGARDHWYAAPRRKAKREKL